MPALRKLSRASAASLVLGLWIAATAAAAAARPAIQIDNFGQVNANYYRGGQPEGTDYADLKALGIKTVINLTSDDAEANEEAMVKRAGMTYFSIPMTTHTEPTNTQVSQFLNIVNDPANQPVYVHCVGGRHRTGVMTAVYRMTNDSWTSDRAFSEMKQYKFGADFLHSEFKNFVYRYPVEMTKVAALNAGNTSTSAAKADVKAVKEQR